MRKKLIAISLAFFLMFSIVSSEYYSTKVHAAATGAAVAVAGGGFAAGAAALLPVVAVVGLVALGGYGIYSHVSKNAAEQGMTKTEYMQGVFEDFCESTGQSTTAQANAMMNDVTVMQDGTIGITNAASGVWHDFLDWMATSAGAGELATYVDEQSIPLGSMTVGPLNYKLVNSVSYAAYTGDTITVIFNKPVYVAYYKDQSGNNIELVAPESGTTYVMKGVTSVTPTPINFPIYINGETFYLATLVVTNLTPINIPQNPATIRNYTSDAPIYTYNDNAFIGKWTDMTGAATYQEMDVLTGDQTFVLNPDITDAIAKALEGVISRALTLDIPTYFNLVMDVINGAPTISIPYENTFIDIAAPTFAPVDNSITNNIDITEGTTVINITKPIVDDAIAFPSLTAMENFGADFADWALGYLSPAEGLFSKFPFCVPYDFYLLFNALGGQAPGNSARLLSSGSGGGNSGGFYGTGSPIPLNISVENDFQAPSEMYDENAGDFSLSWNISLDFPGMATIPLTIDLQQFNWLFSIIRITSGALWMFGLFRWVMKEG